MSKLFFFDVDGTLYSHRTHIIPESTQTALKQLQSRGYMNFLSTGRTYGMCQEIEGIPLDGAIICNGAGIILQDKLIKAHYIPDHLVQKMLTEIEARQGAFQIQDAKYGYQNQLCHDNFEKSFKERYDVDDIDAFFLQKGMHRYEEYQGDPILKIDFTFFTKEDIDAFCDSLDPSLYAILSESYNLNLGRYYGELMCKEATKGNAITYLANYLDIDMKETYGFGDSDNDVSMIETCAIGVAMGNGTQTIKDKADYITTDVDQDGICHALRHFQILDE